MDVEKKIAEGPPALVIIVASFQISELLVSNLNFNISNHFAELARPTYEYNNITTYC